MNRDPLDSKNIPLPSFFLRLKRQKRVISSIIGSGMNFFRKNVRIELDFFKMNATLDYLPDAGVAQW